MLRINQAGIDLIKKFEGCRLHAYLCPKGIPTIGYGHTGPGVEMGVTWTQEEAEKALTTDLNLFSKLISVMFQHYRINHQDPDINSNQFSAMVSFAYNVRNGIEILKNILNRYGINGFPNLVERYCHCDGVVLAGLLNRRKAEKQLFLKVEE